MNAYGENRHFGFIICADNATKMKFIEKRKLKHMRLKLTFGDYGPKEKKSHMQLSTSRVTKSQGTLEEVEIKKKGCYKAKIVTMFFNSRNDRALTIIEPIIKKGPSRPKQNMLLVGEGEGGLKLCPIPLPLNYL